MKVRKVAFASVLGLAASIGYMGVAGAAVSSSEARSCTATGKAEDRIVACTDVIMSAALTGEDVTHAYRLRGLAYRDANDYERAIEDFDEALRLQPGNASILFERAGTFTSLGEFSSAISDYDSCLAIDPANPRAFFQRGVVYYRLGEHPLALNDYNEALRLDPHYPPVYNERAWTLYLLGKYSAALTDTEHALSLRPSMASALDTRGHVLTALGRTGEALTAFEHAMDAGGRRFVRLYQRALTRHGYYEADADGVYVEGMRGALRACLEDQCRLLK